MSAASFKVGLDQIEKVVSYLKEKIGSHDAVIFLNGDLAAGKTTFVQKYTHSEAVTSPTFSLQNIYENGVYHYDLYNCDFDKFMQTGLVYEFEKEGVHFVEWADERLKEFCLHAGFYTIEIDIKNLDTKREYQIYEA